MDNKSAFINWVSKNKLKGISSEKLALIIENTFYEYLGVNVWNIKNPKEFGKMHSSLLKNRVFKMTEKNSYNIISKYAKHYQLYLEFNFLFLNSIDNQTNDKIDFSHLKLETEFENKTEEKKLKRLLWDKYETALLIEAFWKIENKEAKRLTVLEELSRNLRKKALNQGIEIDDTFRYINGMTYKMSEITAFFYPEVPRMQSPKIDEEIVELYKTNKNQFNHILNKAHQLVNEINIEERSSIEDFVDKSFTPTSKTERSEFNMFIREILVHHFSNGIDIEKLIDMIRFKQFYLTDYGVELMVDDNEIKNVIQSMTIKFEKKYYVVSQEIKDKVTNLLIDILNDSYKIIHIEMLYNTNLDLFESNSILNYKMLIVIVREILSLNKDKFPNVVIKGEYISLMPKLSELSIIEEEIMRVWGEKVLQTVDELTNKLPYILLSKMKYALAYSDFFQWNSKDTYANSKFFICSDDELQKISIYVKEKCLKDGNVAMDSIPLDTVFIDNYELSSSAIFDFIYLKLKNDFERKANVLSFYGENDDVEKQIERYCKKHAECTINDIGDIMRKAIGRVDLWRVVEYTNHYMIRIDEDHFVADDKVNFNAIKIDSVLDEIVRGEFIGIKEIVTYVRFPQCEYPWNAFLLESFIRRFSDTYKYLSLSSNSKNIGAIVRKINKDDYHMILAKAIARSSVALNKDEIYDFLVEMGYLGRRTYKRIEELIMNAKNIRVGEL